MFKAILLFLLGFVLLIKGGDWFVEGASRLAKRLKVPELLIGATVVSIGTTLPEVMVSAASAVSGHGEIAYGNAIGSVICNTALIAALTIAIRPAKVDKKTFRIPVLFFFAAAVFYCLVSWLKGSFSRPVGILLLTLFIAYMLLSVRQALKHPEEAGIEAAPEGSPSPLWKELLLLIVGAALIAIGADLLVDNGTIIARGLGVPESVIGLTFVALGTSLPELVTAVTALVKGHSALSIGNIVGANLFNLVLVSGLSVTLNPFTIPQQKLIAGVNASKAVDLPVMLFVMAFLTLPALKRERLNRFQGVLLLCVYAGFCVFQFA